MHNLTTVLYVFLTVWIIFDIQLALKKTLPNMEWANIVKYGSLVICNNHTSKCWTLQQNIRHVPRNRTLATLSIFFSLNILSDVIGKKVLGEINALDFLLLHYFMLGILPHTFSFLSNNQASSCTELFYTVERRY